MSNKNSCFSNFLLSADILKTGHFGGWQPREATVAARSGHISHWGSLVGAVVETTGFVGGCWRPLLEAVGEQRMWGGGRNRKTTSLEATGHWWWNQLHWRSLVGTGGECGGNDFVGGHWLLVGMGGSMVEMTSLEAIGCWQCQLPTTLTPETYGDYEELKW
ncbi:hypothetical protein F5887DRAFT_919555 [Amanita rubescens]|nr:hypothetical protein F5887DRAFT_919555 [Amanita rubescens]